MYDLEDLGMTDLIKPINEAMKYGHNVELHCLAMFFLQEKHQLAKLVWFLKSRIFVWGNE